MSPVCWEFDFGFNFGKSFIFLPILEKLIFTTDLRRPYYEPKAERLRRAS